MNDATIELLRQYLSPEERAEVDALLAQESAPSLTALSFREFVAAVNPRYEWYPHCEVLAATLQKVADDELLRVMVFMPPRHGKSELVSRHFPAYYLLRHPDRWAGVCSYEATLAEGFSRVARDAFQREGGELRGDSSAVALWQTTYGGGMWAAGVGGPITGKGAHLGIIDDPVKNDEEARSETIRAKHKNWYDSTFYTRLEPNGAVVIVQTRWHEDDLSGYLLEQEKSEVSERWHIVSFQAIKDDGAPKIPITCTLEPDGRAPGEALCPERYGLEALGRIKQKVGSYFWSAMYQQAPAPPEGGMFKRSWWRFYTERPQQFDFLAHSWDMSLKDTKASDYVAGHVWGVKGPNAYLVDRVHDRMDMPTTCMAVKALSAKWPKAVAKFIEDKANGPAVIATLQRTIPGFIAVDPQGGKEARAAAVSPLVEAGNVWLPDPSIAPWVHDVINECAAFPNGTHDDDVDALSQALARLMPMMQERSEPKPRSRPNVDTSQNWIPMAKKAGTYKGGDPGRGVRVPRLREYEELD